MSTERTRTLLALTLAVLALLLPGDDPTLIGLRVVLIMAAASLLIRHASPNARRKRHGRMEVGPGMPTPDVSGNPPASQVRWILQFNRPVSERELEEFAMRWTRQYSELPERDYLGEALAREEHRQGLPYGDDPDHCGECGAEALRRRQAACEHDGDQIDVSTCATRELLCQDCGTIREVAR